MLHIFLNDAVVVEFKCRRMEKMITITPRSKVLANTILTVDSKVKFELCLSYRII